MNVKTLHKGYTGVRAERVKTRCNEIAVFPSPVGNHTLIIVTALGLHAWIWTAAQSVIDVDVPLQKKKKCPPSNSQHAHYAAD